MFSKKAGPLRAAIYARYSSDNQREASIDDQVASCRQYIERMNWVCVVVYADAEMTGRNAFRPEYQRMLADSERHRFDVVVTESIDRLSRRVADLAGMYDILSAEGIKLYAVQIGEIGDIHISMLGLVAQQYSKDLAHKTRRGQSGRVSQGKSAGGIAYGYRALPPVTTGKTTEAGDREIIEEQAEVVRRIYRDYASGYSPEAIVVALNTEGVPGPGGRLWRATTLRGQGRRGTGILRNPTYIGKMVWNRASYIRSPKTGKRLARINDPSERQYKDVPHLRIASDELWEAVQDRLQTITDRATAAHRRTSSNKPGTDIDLNATHRPKFLLAGLLKCSDCGASYTVIGKDRYGCANHRRGTGMCENGKTIIRQKVEDRVLTCVSQSLMAPARIELYVTEVREQIRRSNREAAAKTATLRRRHTEVIKAIDNMVTMVESGKAPISILDKLREREAEKAEIEAELARHPATESVVEQMPNLAVLFAKKVAALVEALNDPLIKTEATELIRQLIDRVVMTPDPDAPDGMRMEVHGALAEILALAAGDDPKRKLPDLGGSGSQLSVVAGAGNRRYLHFDMARISPDL